MIRQRIQTAIINYLAGLVDSDVIVVDSFDTIINEVTSWDDDRFFIENSNNEIIFGFSAVFDEQSVTASIEMHKGIFIVVA